MTAVRLLGAIVPRCNGNHHLPPDDVLIFVSSGLVMRSGRCAWLSPSKIKILAVLATMTARGCGATTGDLIEAVYFGDPTGGALEARNLIYQRVAELRSDLAPIGLVFECDGGHLSPLLLVVHPLDTAVAA